MKTFKLAAWGSRIVLTAALLGLMSAMVMPLAAAQDQNHDTVVFRIAEQNSKIMPAATNSGFEAGNSQVVAIQADADTFVRGVQPPASSITASIQKHVSLRNANHAQKAGYAAPVANDEPDPMPGFRLDSYNFCFVTSQEFDVNGNGIADDLKFDTDGDGIIDKWWDDTDGDGIGDYWGYDTDGDGIIDKWEEDTNSDGIPDYWQYDTDGDGETDIWETDSDNNGIADHWEYDTDGDGKVDTWTSDNDNDGDVDEYNTDTDNDGCIDTWGYDDDGDGTIDRWGCDTDGDGKPDKWDYDTDGDGKIDTSPDNTVTAT